ncbi:RHS repeat-associated core domain-containing protein [bacterium endosymbiont of Bathymodiolus sp. 5 South]|uniref:RHS repeat-associated core domain-containing protein n=1 Tax=bacterium endosymbiont of Bathymodiolus sp. 5 South TaxID=1181670 RepID=UPI0010B8F745|nr:RHS repeat-associated core domain-containing protein [bacterium endosymbiont of Bathymodiolus sp. 5 South]SSC08931.1 insecticidal toxin complex protein [bacterium endosymbiont of Bathymodiolus sp. 5 South]
MNTLEPYQQIYTYDTGNNLTNLSHQANSGNWQQTLTIHPNNNRGTENNNQNNFDANGNLLNLNNIGSLEWHYNNTLNKLTKANKPNTTQYYVYDYQGKRVRTVIESEHQTQSQRDYLPALDISINQAKQQSKTLHIGTHILSESSKDNTQTHYQLNSHLQSNTLELGGKAQTLSYEHYYPYGGTAIIAGKDKTQAQQKRYRYTGKERDDNSGLCYYGARYLAPWLARWINPDAAGSIDGLNLYVYVGNNPLKYIDPTGHVKVIPADINLANYEIDVLSPIEGTYQNNNLFHFPESYERLENIVRTYPADKLNLLNTNTEFSIEPEWRNNGELIIQAHSHPPSDYFKNAMNFSTGELVFDSNFKNEYPGRRSGLNATEVISYQYLGMTKIAGALNILPQTMLQQNITNPSANEAMEIYRADRNYPKFYRNFLIKSDNGRSSLRITNTFSLKVDSVELEATGSNVRLYLEPKMPLISAEEPLPPRGDMHEYFAPTSRLSRIIQQTNYCAIL